MTFQDIKLLQVTIDNHNKFYDMHDNNDGTFTAHWGRVGNEGKDTVYPINKWQSVLNSKLNKGYKDVTGYRTKVGDYLSVSDEEINKLLNAFLENSRQYVASMTATVAISETSEIEAQKYINELAKNIDVQNPDQGTLNAFNKYLLKLFEIIPRKMHRVQDELCATLDDRSNIITKEQSLLDNLINMTKNAPTGNQKTIEDAFGFKISKCSNEEIEYIKNKLAEDGFTRYKFSRAWKINTPAREAEFKDYLANNNLDDKAIKMYWHGTGTENILAIMSSGLLIRPSNASTTGNMYGNGIYNAPNADKASGYTSIAGSYWKGGSSNSAYMFINAVIMGKQFDVKDNYERYNGIAIRNLDGDKFSSANLGYHSVYAHSGGYLKRDETIIYNQSQVACRYLVEFIK